MQTTFSVTACQHILACFDSISKNTEDYTVVQEKWNDAKSLKKDLFDELRETNVGHDSALPEKIDAETREMLASISQKLVDACDDYDVVDREKRSIKDHGKKLLAQLLEVIGQAQDGNDLFTVAIDSNAEDPGSLDATSEASAADIADADADADEDDWEGSRASANWPDEKKPEEDAAGEEETGTHKLIASLTDLSTAMYKTLKDHEPSIKTVDDLLRAMKEDDRLLIGLPRVGQAGVRKFRRCLADNGFSAPPQRDNKGKLVRLLGEKE